MTADRPRPGTDCAETRALLALLVDNEDRARWELRPLGSRARGKCAEAARQLAQLCEEPPGSA